jgi:hypothetical protein
LFRLSGPAGPRAMVRCVHLCTPVVAAFDVMMPGPPEAGLRYAHSKSLCQRYHLLHDWPYHLAQRWLTYRMRWAIGDLFLGPYVRG